MGHTSVQVRGNQLIFTYPERVGCDEANIEFELFNGNPYVTMGRVRASWLSTDGLVPRLKTEDGTLGNETYTAEGYTKKLVNGDLGTL